MNYDVGENKCDECDEYDEGQWTSEALEARARRNRASWRSDCVEICASDEHSPVIHELAARLIRLIDETECMYHGGPVKVNEIAELSRTLDALRAKLQA